MVCEFLQSVFVGVTGRLGGVRPLRSIGCLEELLKGVSEHEKRCFRKRILEGGLRGVESGRRRIKP